MRQSRKTLTQTITEMEYDVAKYKFVLANFPDAKLHAGWGSPHFSSKSVNTNYTNFDFVKSAYLLTVLPYSLLTFEYNGKIEDIKIHSSPRTSRLARVSWKNDKRVIKFSRLSINMKNHNFKEDMLNSCRTHIMSFIKDNSKLELDTKHLEPRLKKLIVFT
jgi:hypothetical protein